MTHIKIALITLLLLFIALLQGLFVYVFLGQIADPKYQAVLLATVISSFVSSAIAISVSIVGMSISMRPIISASVTGKSQDKILTLYIQNRSKFSIKVESVSSACFSIDPNSENVKINAFGQDEVDYKMTILEIPFKRIKSKIFPWLRKIYVNVGYRYVGSPYIVPIRVRLIEV